MVDSLAGISSVRHNPRLHSAAKTDEYLYNQLIPYIGNKRKLLPLITEAIAQTGQNDGLFVDFFAGSGVVSRLAKTLGFAVVANDWEPYAKEINTAYVGCNEPPEFAGLGGYETAFETLNGLPPIEGYITRYYCPKDDSDPDPRRERMFFTRRNGMAIDAMRERIAEWEDRGLLSSLERAFLLAPFLYAASYVSNTSGVFKAYHNGWGGQTRTALYRILSEIRLNPPVLFDNGRINTVTMLDAQELAERIECDIAYVDPPYNQHPYGSNYHLLNTIALWDKLQVEECILANGRMVNKSAIRTDWRTERRSAYNYRATALGAFTRLIFTIRARFILVSYSTDGIIPLDELICVLRDRGRVTSVSQQYKRYRVSSQRYSHRSHNVEHVWIVDCR